MCAERQCYCTPSSGLIRKGPPPSGLSCRSTFLLALYNTDVLRHVCVCIVTS